MTNDADSSAVAPSQKPGLGMGALLHVGAAFLGHAHQYDRIFRWHDEGANHGQVFADQCVSYIFVSSLKRLISVIK